jgi:hypothetical protein
VARFRADRPHSLVDLASIRSCADYADWYAAQNAYEAAGGTAASGAIVESLDPDRDGIACESMMEA